MDSKAPGAPWRIYQAFLFLGGMIFLVFGTILLVFPLIPWVYGLILLLWSMWCLAATSELLYRWMISLCYVGPYIEMYLNGGITPWLRRLALLYVTSAGGVLVFMGYWKLASLYLGAAFLIQLLPQRGRRPFA